MTHSHHRLLCRAMTALTLAGIAAGLVVTTVRLLDRPMPWAAWVPLAIVWATIVIPQATFAAAQLSPAGRQAVPAWGERGDGWMAVLAGTVLIAALFATPDTDGNRDVAAFSLALSVLSVMLLVVRRRQLRQEATARLEPQV